MVKIEVTLISSDGPERESVSFEIPKEEWTQLVSFHDEVERLRSTRFVQKERGGQISFTCCVREPLRSNAKLVDFEEVGTMLLRLRPFVLNKEAYYFHKIKNILKRRLDHRAFCMHIGLLDNGFSLKSMQCKISFDGQGRSPLSVAMVMDWLNSYEYHRDPNKRKAVEQDLGILGRDQNGLPVILFALVDMIQAILDLDSLVETLMQVESGARSKIDCPSGFLT